MFHSERHCRAKSQPSCDGDVWVTCESRVLVTSQNHCFGILEYSIIHFIKIWIVLIKNFGEETDDGDVERCVCIVVSRYSIFNQEYYVLASTVCERPVLNILLLRTTSWVFVTEKMVFPSTFSLVSNLVQFLNFVSKYPTRVEFRTSTHVSIIACTPCRVSTCVHNHAARKSRL